MLEAKEFKAGMHALGAAFDREITRELSAVYWRTFRHRVDTAQWTRGVDRVLTTARFFPVPAVLFEAMGIRPEVSAEQVEAGQVYEAVEKCCTYSPHGSYYDKARIRSELGEAAVQAFTAAGGSRAFLSTDPRAESFTRREFVAAYVSAARAVRSGFSIEAPPDQIEAGKTLKAIEARSAKT